MEKGDTMIKAIFFDLDDTLLWDQQSVKAAFKTTCKIAEDYYGVDSNKLEEAVRDVARNLYTSYQTYSFTQMIGINPFEGLWGEFNDDCEQFQILRQLVPQYRKDAWTIGLKEIGIDDEQLGHKLAETFPIKRKKHPYIYEDTYPVLNQLKDHYRLLLLTNGSPSLQKTKLSLTPELIPYFEQIVISGDYGKGKPDSGIFHHALSLMELNTNEVIMVGDNLNTDILGANRVGIQSIWINREQKERNHIVPSFEINNLNELFSILTELENGSQIKS